MNYKIETEHSSQSQTLKIVDILLSVYKYSFGKIVNIMDKSEFIKFVSIGFQIKVLLKLWYHKMRKLLMIDELI